MLLEKVDRRSGKLFCRLEREMREDLIHSVRFDRGGRFHSSRLVRIRHFVDGRDWQVLESEQPDGDPTARIALSG